MSISCDICSLPVDDTEATQITSDEMRAVVQAGFSIKMISWGPLGKLRQLYSTRPGLAEHTESEWKRGVMTDTTLWNCCARCYSEIKKFNPSISTYKFDSPELYSGFPLESLKYLFVHIPEKDFHHAHATADFVNVASNTTGVDFETLLSSAKTLFVTGSHFGDEVQRTQSLPEQVSEQIELLYPETQDRRRFHLHVRTFKTSIIDRYGLLVFVYKAY